MLCQNAPTMNTITHKQSIPLGILYAILSAFFFAAMSVFVKKASPELPTSMLLFFRFGTSFILLLPWILTDSSFSLKVAEPGRYILRILASLLALFLLFYTIKFIPLTDGLMLNNTAPLFVPIIAWVLVRATISKKAIIGIVIGFIGVGIILHPSIAVFKPVSLLALIAGVLASLAIVQMRLISKTSSTKQMLFYYFLVSAVISGIFAAIQWRSPANASLWWYLAGIGLFGTLYQVFATFSYVTAPVRLMSPFTFLIVVFGALFDWLIWNNAPTWATLGGALLVIIGSIMTVVFGHKEIKSNSLKTEGKNT